MGGMKCTTGYRDTKFSLCRFGTAEVTVLYGTTSIYIRAILNRLLVKHGSLVLFGARLSIRQLFESLAFIGDLAFIITLASNLKVCHTYYRFYVNVKLLFSFYSMRWHQDSCTKQDNLQMYSSNRCPAECGVFGETAAHVVLKTQLATAFYRTLRRCKNYFC